MTWSISIHALREEGDPHRHHLSKLAQKFLSTPSARRATCCRPPARGLSPISIHALREEGDRRRRTGAVQRKISIHALREEGDWDAAGR